MNREKEALEWLQYDNNLKQRALVEIAKGVIDAKFPMCDGLGWPIRSVGQRMFTYPTPRAVTTIAAGTKKEKAEAKIANIADYEMAEEECLCYAIKDSYTEDMLKYAGLPVVRDMTKILTQMISIPIEKAVIDAMVATTCQTLPAQACWDVATTYVTSDIMLGRTALAQKGFPRNTHRLIVDGHDFASIVSYMEGKGYLKFPEREKPLTVETVSQILDMPVIIEDSMIDVAGTDTPILSDTAILVAYDVDYGALFQSKPFSIRTWKDENLELHWIQASREVLPKRIINDAIYTITNTAT